MTESQIKHILNNLQKDGDKYHYVVDAKDRDIYTHLKDIAPYVIGYEQRTREFYCQGISQLGKELLT